MFEIGFIGLNKNYIQNMEANKIEKNMILIVVMEYIEYNKDFEFKED